MSARRLGSLTLDLIARIGGFREGLDQAARIAENRSRRIQNSMRGLGRTVTGVFAALGGTALIRSIIRASAEQENALRQLEQRIKSTAGAAGLSSGQLVGFANSLQKVTTFSDDAIVEMQSLLLTFTNLRGDVFNRTTEAALDLSVALGQDLQTSAQTLGRALNNPIEGISRLARAGVSLDEDQKKLIKRMAETGDVIGAQNALLGELEKRFGGSAKAAADTFGGALEQVKLAFGELLEAPGGMQDAKAGLQDLAKILQDPETVAAAGELTSALIEGLTEVARILPEVTGGFRVLFGSGATEVEKLDLQIELLQRKLRGEGPFDIPGILNLDWIEDAPVFIAGARALEREIDRLIAKRNALLQPAPPSGTGAGAVLPGATNPPAVRPASAEFVKLEAELKEQIVLYGKVGEAAKLAYLYSAGALEDLTAAEFDQLIALAKQYDSTVRLADAAKEAAAAEKELKQAYEQQLKALEDQLQLTESLTEADKIRIETTIGSLKKLKDVDKEHLIEVAVRVDQQRASEDLEDINLQILELRGNTSEAITIRFDREFADERERFRQTGDTEGQRRLDELRALKVSKAEFNELQEEARRITEDLALQEERIRNSQEAGANTEFEAMRKIGEERETTLEQLQAILAEMEAIAAVSGNPELLQDAEAFRAEIEKLRGETNLLAQSIESNLKESFGDAFGDFLKGTKSAKEAFQSLIDDMRNRILDFAIENLMEKMFGGISGMPGIGGVGGGGFGGFLGALFGGGRALGGDVKAGMFYEWQEGGREYFAPGVDGAVIPELALAGGGDTYNMNFNVPSQNGHVPRQTLTQLSAAVARGLAEANRRNN